MHHPWLDLDTDILADNIHHIRRGLRPETEMICVVKSDAYGHGAKDVVRRAVAEGVNWFSVAYVFEALEIREVAPDADILILGVVDPRDTETLVEQNLTPVVVSPEHAAALGAEARALGKTLKGHVKVDTGMGRLGIPPEMWEAELEKMFVVDGLQITGICSHLATIDLKRPWLQKKQHHLFVQACDQAQSYVAHKLMRHLCSSRGAQYYPDWDFEAIRPGILLYGYGCTDPRMRFHTRPFLTWNAVLMQVKSVPEGYPVGYYSSYRTTRDTQIGVVCAGYADGYLRSMSNRGEVLIRGSRFPVVGRISMNWVTVDLGPDSGCVAGDEVVLFGRQGGQSLWADVLAKRAGTIAYEILTAIDPRIPRRVI